MKLLGATASDVGNVREANQDRVFFRGLVAALADGMGGHQGGERAAELAIGEFEDASQELSEHDLVEVVLRANRQVHGHAADNGLPGMGTTLVAMTLHGDETITVANVGDSRAYWLRGDYMGQVTEDHSFVEDLVRQGRLTPEEAASHPQRNILTRAVGIGAEVEVDRFPIPEPAVGDRFLLCSDGLFNEISEEEILEILLEAGDPQETADTLVEATLQTPCRDNVTVAVVDVVADDDPRLAAADDKLKAGLDEARVITAPIPVVRKSVLHEPKAADGADESSQQSASGQTATLLLEEVDTPIEDPEIFQDTHELEIIEDTPLVVQPRSRLVLGLVAIAALAVIAAGGFFLARGYAQSGYFVAEDNATGELMIYQGRRGGFLVFEPRSVAKTGQAADQLGRDELERVNGEDFSNREGAEALVEWIQENQTAADLATPEPTASDASESSAESSDTTDVSDTTQLPANDGADGSSEGSASTAEG